jgi:hypothetical protein
MQQHASHRHQSGCPQAVGVLVLAVFKRDLSNTRNAAGSTITSANVSGLKQAWTFHITGPAAAGVGPDGALAANPIVVNGVDLEPRPAWYQSPGQVADVGEIFQHVGRDAAAGVADHHRVAEVQFEEG